MFTNNCQHIYERLKHRMGHFGLRKEPETFDFLGFTHYCSKSRNGKFRVKRKTSRKKFAKKCRGMHQLIKGMRTWKLADIMKKLNQILVGYYHYYGITDNSRSLTDFRIAVMKSLFYRSQKKSYDWAGFGEMLKVYPLEKTKIYVSIYE